jgi:hypothetical protein
MKILEAQVVVPDKAKEKAVVAAKEKASAPVMASRRQEDEAFVQVQLLSMKILCLAGAGQPPEHAKAQALSR